MGEVTITIRANDLSQRELENVVGGLRNVEKQGQATTRTFADLDRGAQALAAGVQRTYGFLGRLDITSISLTQNQDRLTQAQRAYDSALSDGSGSVVKTIQARRDLESAEASLEKTQQRARISYVAVGADLVSIGAKAIPAAVGLRNTAAASFEAARGMTTAEIAATGLAAGLGAVSLTLIGLAVMSQFNKDLERGRTATEELALAQEDLQKKAARPNFFGGAILGGIEKAAGYIPGVTTATEELEQATNRVAEAEQGVADERAINAELARIDADKAAAEAKQKADEVQRLWETTNRGIYASLKNGLGAVGAQLDQLTAAAQKPLLLQAGIDPKMVETIMATAEAEDKLTTAALTSSKELRAQTTVTAKKGETTEDFRKRLLEMGYTEEEIAQRLDKTGRVMRSQTDATDDAADAVVKLGDAWNLAGSKASAASGGGGSISGPGAVPFASSSLGGYADMAAAAMAGQSSLYKGDKGAARLNEHITLGGNGRTFDRNVLVGANRPTGYEALREELQVLLSMHPDALSHAEVSTYFSYLQRPWGRIDAGTAQRMRGKAMPFLAAAQGFHGDVNQPTLMLVGEAGRERVDVTPGSRRGAGGRPIVLNQHFYGQADAGVVQRASMRGLGLQLIRMGLQGMR